MDLENRVKWIDYRGKKVLFKDYSNLEGGELMEMLKHTEDIYADVDSQIRLLLNFENSRVNRDFLDEIVRIGNKYKQYLVKVATIGLSPNQLILAEVAAEQTNLMGISRYYSNVAEAKEYLVS